MSWKPTDSFDEIISLGFRKIIYLSILSTTASLLAVFVPVLAPIFFLISFLCTILIPGIHLFYLRTRLVTPIRKILSPERMLIIRWLSRFCFANLIILVYTPSTFWLAIITCPAGFYLYTWLQVQYCDWQLEREQAGEELLFIENFLVKTFFIMMFLLFITLIVMGAGVGYLIQMRLETQGILPS